MAAFVNGLCFGAGVIVGIAVALAALEVLARKGLRWPP